MAKKGVWKQRGHWFKEGIADGYVGREPRPPGPADLALAYDRGYRVGSVEGGLDVYEVWSQHLEGGKLWRMVMCQCDAEWKAKEIARALERTMQPGVISWGRPSYRPTDLPWYRP